MRTTLMAAVAAWITCLGMATPSHGSTLTPYVSGSGDYTHFGTSQSQVFDVNSYPVMTSTIDPAASNVRLVPDTSISSSASIVAGSALAAGTATMAWRTRAPEETWNGQASPPLPSLSMALCSDVVQFGEFNGTFALQMNFIENAVEAAAADEMNLLYLAWMNPNAAGGATWTNATNLGTRGANAVDHYHGTYADFQANVIQGSNLAAWAGSWGTDLTSGTVWAIVNADLTAGGMGPQQFAAVPEPGTMVLLGAGLMVVGVVSLKRRRKQRTDR